MLRAPLPAILALLFAACSESSAPACATQIASEVCATPAQLRGAEPVLPSSSSAVAVTLPAAPLAEGRYVLVARSQSCAAPEPAPGPVQGVLELSGCVLRRTLVSEAPAATRVEVFELAYAGEGALVLQRRCPAEEAGTLDAGYGFDGERLELALARAVGEGDPAPCDTLETWELR